MKKEIYCRKCMTRVQVILDKQQMPPGEHIKYVLGTLRVETAVCDFCNIQLFENQECCAFSNYIDGQAPYIPWEHDYIFAQGDPKPLAIKTMGVYPLLITGDDQQLMEFTISTSMVLNFLERRLNTVYAMCMAESLEFATGLAGKLNMTIQYIDHDTDGNELYPLLNKGSHALWEKGGYPDES